MTTLLPTVMRSSSALCPKPEAAPSVSAIAASVHICFALVSLIMGISVGIIIGLPHSICRCRAVRERFHALLSSADHYYLVERRRWRRRWGRRRGRNDDRPRSRLGSGGHDSGGRSDFS